MRQFCTRGLKRFEEVGCPERPFNKEDGTGCPLWYEMEVPTRENPQTRIKERMCIDNWYFLLQWSALGYLEGNQQAVESFRNGMCEVVPIDPNNPNKGGRVQPKAVNMIIQMDKESVVKHIEEAIRNRELKLIR